MSAPVKKAIQMALEAHCSTWIDDSELKETLFVGSSGALVHPVAVLRLENVEDDSR